MCKPKCYAEVVINDYGHCHFCIADDCSMIYNLYVYESCRRQGHAKDLIKEAICKIRKHGYENDIRIIADPDENSISKKDLEIFYTNMGLKID